jgi:SpoVK/Ycf46/Vps4 family AAA+-type ATPase
MEQHSRKYSLRKKGNNKASAPIFLDPSIAAQMMADAEAFYKKAEDYRKVSELEGALINFISASICVKHAIELRGRTRRSSGSSSNSSAGSQVNINLKSPRFDPDDPDSTLVFLLNYVVMLQKLLKEKKQKYGCHDDDDESEKEESCEDVHNLLVEGKNCVFFNDIIGNDAAKDNVRQGIIYPFEYPRMYPKRAKGILFYGPPGTGKTFFVKAAITEMQTKLGDSFRVLFYAPTGAELKGKFVGETEKKITSYFRCASSQACKCEGESKMRTLSVLFIDEIDSIARNRSNDSSGISANATNTLLQMMDGINNIDNVLVMGATNYPWDIDDAALRRFDIKIMVSLPDASARLELLKLYIFQHVENCIAEVSTRSTCENTETETDKDAATKAAAAASGNVTCPGTSVNKGGCTERTPVNFAQIQGLVNISTEDLDYLARKMLGARAEFADFSPDDIKNLVMKVSRKSALATIRSGQFFKAENDTKVFQGTMFSKMKGKLFSLGTMTALKNIFPGAEFAVKNIVSGSSSSGAAASPHVIVRPTSPEDFQKFLGKAATISPTAFTRDVHALMTSYVKNQLGENKLFVKKCYVESYLVDAADDEYSPLLPVLRRLDSNHLEVYLDYNQQSSSENSFYFLKPQSFQVSNDKRVSINVLFEGVMLHKINKKTVLNKLKDTLGLGIETEEQKDKYVFSSLQRWTPFIKQVYVDVDGKGFKRMSDKLASKFSLSTEKIDKALFSSNDLVVDSLSLDNVFSCYLNKTIDVFFPHKYEDVDFRFLTTTQGGVGSVGTEADKSLILNFDFNIEFFREALNKDQADYSRASSLQKNVTELENYKRTGAVPRRKA